VGPLHLTEDQEKQISPIIQESCNKRIEILNSSNGDRKAMKSALQQVQWTTDIKLGQVLTKKQMEEYQNLLDEHGDKTTGTDTHRGKGGRGGGLRGFQHRFSQDLKRHN
jgi:Tfp pilus assembly protein PilN